MKIIKNTYETSLFCREKQVESSLCAAKQSLRLWPEPVQHRASTVARRQFRRGARRRERAQRLALRLFALACLNGRWFFCIPKTYIPETLTETELFSKPRDSLSLSLSLFDDIETRTSRE